MRTLFILLALILASPAAEKFLGWQSCASSGCHGGGKGDDQFSLWKKDRHWKAHEILTAGQSKTIADTLGIKEPQKDAQCTACHSPMLAVPESRRAGELREKPNSGVSCENCHGPGEDWLRFHTRPDVTHEQRVAAGMRDVHSTYAKANACVGCHTNISAALRKAGHPELRFDLARQLIEMPPHWELKTPPARSWLTGQAALLRELCWYVENGRAPDGANERIAALHWLLRETELGATHLPEANGPRLREAADKLARAAGVSKWTPLSTRAQLDRLTALVPSLKGADATAQFRRAQALARAMNGLAYGIDPALVTKARDDFDFLAKIIHEPLNFDLAKFEATAAKITATLAVKP